MDAVPVAAPAESAAPPASLSQVKITMDEYHGAIDTFPRHCATPRVWIENLSPQAVQSVNVVFSVSILDISARLSRPGPDTGTGTRAVDIPPQSKRSVPLKFCIDAALLPPTAPGHAYPNAITRAESVVQFRAFA